MMLSSEDLLAGSSLTHQVAIPSRFLPGKADSPPRQVTLKPLSVSDIQRIDKAAKDDESLSAALIIKQALAEPSLTLDQVMALPAGLGQFLVEKVNAISGIDMPRDALEEYVQAPLAKACFILAKEFGWTPEQVSGMTIGQILLYLEMARSEGKSHDSGNGS